MKGASVTIINRHSVAAGFLLEHRRLRFQLQTPVSCQDFLSGEALPRLARTQLGFAIPPPIGAETPSVRRLSCAPGCAAHAIA